MNGVPHRVSRDDRGFVRSLAPGVVVSIPVAPGDEVARGDVVAVIESMKMESSLAAPFHGRVREVLARPNVQVDAQAPLRAARAARGRGRGGRRAPASPSAAVRGAPSRSDRRAAGRTSSGSSGWCSATTSTPSEGRRLAAELDESCGDLLGCDPLLVPGEHHLLDVFADLRSLTRRRHDSDDPEGDLLRSPQEYLHSYLRSLDAEAEGLPPRFVELARARPAALRRRRPRAHARRSSGPATGCSCPRSGRRLPGPP